MYVPQPHWRDSCWEGYSQTHSSKADQDYSFMIYWLITVSNLHNSRVNLTWHCACVHSLLRADISWMQTISLWSGSCEPIMVSFSSNNSCIILNFSVALKSNIIPWGWTVLSQLVYGLKNTYTFFVWSNSEWALANSSHCLGRIEPRRLEFLSNWGPIWPVWSLLLSFRVDLVVSWVCSCSKWVQSDYFCVGYLNIWGEMLLTVIIVCMLFIALRTRGAQLGQDKGCYHLGLLNYFSPILEICMRRVG